MRLFDTHCHFEKADPTAIAAILERAKAAGVEKLMAVGGSAALNEAAEVAAEVAAESAVAPAVCVALGYDREQVAKQAVGDRDGGGRGKGLGRTADRRQPTDRAGTAARTADSRQPTARGLTPFVASSFVAPVCRLSPVGCHPLSSPLPPLAAIGEIGLDYHYSPETREAQLALFAAQLEEARARDLPVVIHTREADEDTTALLREIPSRGIIHCYTGTPEFAKRYLDLGFFISISGIVTFKPADNVRESALVVPDDRILIETDAPFLAPVPMRGNANEPAFVKYTCEFLAKLRGTDPEAFAELTFANAERALGRSDA